MDVIPSPVPTPVSETSFPLMGGLGCAFLLLVLLALFLSIAGIVVVARSKGALSGMGFAVGGVVLSVVLLLGAPMAFATLFLSWSAEARERSASEQAERERRRARPAESRPRPVPVAPIRATLPDLWPSRDSDLPEGFSLARAATVARSAEEISRCLPFLNMDPSLADRFREVRIAALIPHRFELRGFELKEGATPPDSFGDRNPPKSQSIFSPMGSGRVRIVVACVRPVQGPDHDFERLASYFMQRADGAPADRSKPRDKSEEIYRAMQERLARAKTVRVRFESTIEGRPFSGKAGGRALLQEGGRVRIEIDSEINGVPSRSVMASDGKRLSWNIPGFPAPAKEEKPGALDRQFALILGRVDLCTWFFLKEWGKDRPPTDGAPEVELEACGFVREVDEFGNGPAEVITVYSLMSTSLVTGWKDATCAVTYWIDPKTALPLKRIVKIWPKEGEGWAVVTETCSEFSIDGEIDPAEFKVGD